MNIETYEDLSNAVDEGGGVVTVSMGILRDIHGAGKLGINVCTSISEKLAGYGLGHLPETLSSNQLDNARIFKVGSAIGDLIKAVTSIDGQSDEKLRDLATNRSNEVIKKIRDLVCD